MAGILYCLKDYLGVRISRSHTQNLYCINDEKLRLTADLLRRQTHLLILIPTPTFL